MPNLVLRVHLKANPERVELPCKLVGYASHLFGIKTTSGHNRGKLGSTQPWWSTYD